MELSIVIIMVMFAVCVCTVHRSVFYFYSSVITRVRLRMTHSSEVSLERFGDFQLPPQIEQNTVHTHNRHVSRTDKQQLSRPQTTTSTRSGYTSGQSNQQCDLFQDTQCLDLYLIRRLQRSPVANTSSQN